MSSVRFDLPPAAWRALHSGLLDYLLTVEPVIGGALMRRLDGQLRFEFLMLAIHEARLFVPHIQVDADTGAVAIGLAVPMDTGAHWTLFTMDGEPYGVNDHWIDAASRFRLDEELAQIFGGEL